MLFALLKKQKIKIKTKEILSLDKCYCGCSKFIFVDCFHFRKV